MFKGSIVALITPFDETGKIDFFALKGLLHWHLEEGTDGLVLCGTTGEGSALSKEEKLLIFQMAREIAGGKIPLIASTGNNVTHESVFLTQEAKKMGLDGCLTIVPYYSKPTPEGCFQHFAEISKVGLPMIVYHHPGRTGIKLQAKELKRICEIHSVIGIKDATGDLNLAMELIDTVPLFSGDDLLALPQFSIGFTGSITITGNVIPKEWKVFVDLALKGDFLAARKAFSSLYDLCQSLVLETNPQCVKYAVSLLEKCQPYMRLPLIPPKEENQSRIQEILLKPALT